MRLIYTNLLYVLICILLIAARAVATPDNHQVMDSRLLFVFNQPAYAPGDTVYFTGYMLQGNDQLAINKQVVSVKLLGPSKELIYHGRVLFQNGVGVSQIIIPQNIEHGHYQFVSYIETGILTKKPVFHVSYISVSASDAFLSDGQSTTQPDNDTTSFKIATDRDKYGRRSKVNVSITPGVSLSKSSLTLFSVAVYNEQLFKDTDEGKLTSTIQMPGIYPDTPKEGGPLKVLDYPYYFMGKASVKTSGMAVPDSSKITFYLNESDFVFAVYTNSGGNFNFPLFSNFGNEEVFYRISYKGEVLKDSHITLHDIPVDEEIIKSRRSDTLNTYGVYAKQKKIINSSYQYFASKETKKQAANMVVSDIESDSEILLEKFESFPSMEDVFGNIVPTVRYRKSGDTRRIQIFLQRTAKYGLNDPIYIVDGIMTDDTQYVLSLDPGLVRKISVLRSETTLSRFGDFGLDGILLIETDIADTRKTISNSEKSLTVVGISKEEEYKKTVYNENRLTPKTPDLRSSLYWNPRADWNTMKSFDFYTSDDIGYYIIQVAGLMDGKPFLSTKRFYVTHHVNE